MTWRFRARSRGRLARIGLLMFCGAVLSGCGQPGILVSVESRLSDIIFGATTKHHKVATPTPPPLPAPEPQPPLIPQQLFEPGFAPKPFPVPKFHADACPAALPGAAALVAAASDADNPPKAAAYRWYASYLTFNGAGVPVGYAAGFETRLVSNVQQQPDTKSTQTGNTIHHWTYDTTQPDPLLNNGTMVISFVTQTYSDIDNNQASVTVGANTGATPTEANVDPNGGIAIHEIRRFDAKGNLIQTFNPTASPGTDSANAATGGQANTSTDLLLETLPVVAGGGYSWDFKSADAADQWTMEIAAQSGNFRTEVDACGTIVDGWPVDATVTISKKDQFGNVHPNMSQHWHYVVAPQYGGIVIEEEITGTTENGSIQTIEKLAGLDFGPLPAGIK